ncbi:MAG: M14 family metallopeptidase, partial [Flavobacteriaceae bacterium]
MKQFLFLSVFFISGTVLAQDANVSLSYYLPTDVTYASAIPTPESIIGHEVGEWHVTHDKLVQYMYALAAASDRITIENRGTTFEGRPLILLTITAPTHHAHLETIKSAHFSLTEKDAASLAIDKMPIVVYQGFSIHGNEPSGSNAALLVAYYLAAAQGPKIDTLLNNTVILFDPSFNPDGLQRFSTWANSHKAQNINPDPNDREYNEVWPGGRTNHYWFDLNRDWLPAQLPESRVRIKTFHEWYPNIVTDHHEMGTHSTFFFQPGIPSRTHPLTPKKNQELTAAIGKFHAKAFDKLGSFYYTEEDYDDFYYGKGSTFPDINGAVGILFEQASSRGHAQESDNGILTF